MKKKLKTKLALDRETVTVLQSDSLDAVNGGNAGITPACSLPTITIRTRIINCTTVA